MITTDSTGTDLATGVPDDFFTAYIEAALWSSTDEEGEPLDASYYKSDLSTNCRDKFLHDCADFLKYCEDSGIDPFPDYLSRSEQWSSTELSGHDFWLTRNRHGIGYWDRGLGELGQQLRKAAHTFGEVYLYVSDPDEDGEVTIECE